MGKIRNSAKHLRQTPDAARRPRCLNLTRDVIPPPHEHPLFGYACKNDDPSYENRFQTSAQPYVCSIPQPPIKPIFPLCIQPRSSTLHFQRLSTLLGLATRHNTYPFKTPPPMLSFTKADMPCLTLPHYLAMQKLKPKKANLPVVTDKMGLGGLT